MFLDALGLVSDAQAFPGAATVSTNTIDLGPSVPVRELGTGEPVGFGIGVDVAAGAGSTVLVEVIQSASANLAAPDVIASFSDLAAVFTAGALFFLPLPPGRPQKRYLGIRVTVTGGTTTVTITAWLTARSLFSIAQRYYAKNYAV